MFYRAPEIIIGSEDYLLGVDMWSLGCILHDLLTGSPLFAHNNDNEVLGHIFMMLGFPMAQDFPSYYELPKFLNLFDKVGFKKLYE